jgi:sterol desaturase/sphingolipid hydroxylase (fatty acid hydroxylase superfamily)
LTTDTASTTRTDQLSASPPMFKWPWLDRLSRVHHLVPVAIFVPAIIVLFAVSVTRLGVLAIIALVAGGYAFWTLFEYWLHRIVFHFEPAEGLGARLHWIIHGVHHDHPNDPKRLVMPPSVSVPLALIMFGLFVLVLGAPAAYMFMSAFLASYLFYDELHYYLHHGRPTTWAGRKLRELHMRHHFQDDTIGYGISAPWWDTVFGTSYRDKRTVGAAAPDRPDA